MYSKIFIVQPLSNKYFNILGSYMSFAPFTYNQQWFESGIPPAHLIAIEQQPNLETKEIYPDLSNTIWYNFNQLGYRDKNWSDDDINRSIWCVGHSDVLGVGVENYETWTRRLEVLTNNKTINLGSNGASWDTIARIISSGLKKYRPKKIIIQATTAVRREFVSHTIQRNLIPHLPESYLPYKDFWKHIDDESNQYSLEKNMCLIEQASKLAGVDVFIFDLKDRWAMIKDDPAKDGQHIGKNIHAGIAEYLNQQLFQ